jgi:hypothetical protein
MQAGGGSAGLAMLDWLDETGADNDSCHYHNDNGAILTPICFARSIANEIHTQGHVRMAPAARLAPGRQLPAAPGGDGAWDLVIGGASRGPRRDSPASRF